MKRNMHLGGAVGICLAAMLAAEAEASVVKRTVPDLIGESDVVIHGRVKGSISYWSGGIIVTEHTVQLITPVVGNAGAAEVAVITKGGIVGDIGLHVSDQPEISPGEEVVLFLEGGAPGEFTVAGSFQGKAEVQGRDVPAFDVTLDEFLQGIAAGGVGLERNPTHKEGHNPPGGGGGKGGGGDDDGGGKKCYDLCRLDWKENGDFFDGKHHPGLEDNGTSHWSINNISQEFDDTTVRNELLASAAVWNDTAGACWGLGTVNDVITHDTGLTGAVFDGRNAVTFGDTGSSVAEVANWFFRNDRKNIIETDMTFNDIDYDYGIDVCGSATEFDFRNIAVHEHGHWICLGDQYDADDAEHTMYGFVAEGECKNRDLHSCDQDGAQAVYGTCP